MTYNTDIAKGQWNELKGKIKSKWANFTDQDLKSIEGNFDELKGKLQSVYGYSKEKANEEFESLVSSFKNKSEKAGDEVERRLDS